MERMVDIDSSTYLISVCRLRSRWRNNSIYACSESSYGLDKNLPFEKDIHSEIVQTKSCGL